MNKDLEKIAIMFVILAVVLAIGKVYNTHFNTDPDEQQYGGGAVNTMSTVAGVAFAVFLVVMVVMAYRRSPSGNQVVGYQ